MDANYCQKCGNVLKFDPFRLTKFFLTNKDLFIVFGVFGAFSLYLTTFLTDSQKIPVTFDYTIQIGTFPFNYLKFGIASCLLLLLILGLLIIFQAFETPPSRRKLLYYISGTGSIERFVFIIPFIFFLFGISEYLYSTFNSEIGLIIPIFSAVAGYCAFFILLREMINAFGKSLKAFFIISFILSMIVGTAQQIATPLIPSTSLLLNTIFTYNMMFGQGIGLLLLFSFAWLLFELVKILKNRLGFNKKPMPEKLKTPRTSS
jgi:hypothetical protein